MYIGKNLRGMIALSVISVGLTFTPCAVDFNFLPLPVVSVAHAEVKMYTGIGEGITSDIESPVIAKMRAREDAMQSAKEQAGVYLKTYSKTVDAQLVDDEVSAITNNIVEEIGETQYEVKTVPISDKITLIHYKAIVKVNIDTNGIYDWIKRDEKEKSIIINQTKELKKASKENSRKTENLRNQAINATTEDERDKIKSQFGSVDKEFLANQKNEEGLQFYYQEKYKEAILKYNEAIKINSDFSLAYNNRGLAYAELAAETYDGLKLKSGELKYFKQAIDDFDKAIYINPNFALAYAYRGGVYCYLEDYEQALKDITKAIQFDSNDAIIYKARGFIYYNLGNYDQALEDFQKSIQINPNDAQTHTNLASIYHELEDYDMAIRELNLAIKIKADYAEAYYYRGICYQEIGEDKKAEADFAKARDLGYEG